MRPQILEVCLIRIRNGAPSRKECVVNGQMNTARNKRVRAPTLHNNTIVIVVMVMVMVMVMGMGMVMVMVIVMVMVKMCTMMSFNIDY